MIHSLLRVEFSQTGIQPDRQTELWALLWLVPLRMHGSTRQNIGIQQRGITQ